MVEKDQLYKHLKDFPQAQLSADVINEEKSGKHNLEVDRLPDLRVKHQNNNPLSSLQEFGRVLQVKWYFPSNLRPKRTSRTHEPN